MNGFYNECIAAKLIHPKSCHTAPNERLLQRILGLIPIIVLSCHTAPNERLLQLACLWALNVLEVVIPLRMNGFYNQCLHTG